VPTLSAAAAAVPLAGPAIVSPAPSDAHIRLSLRASGLHRPVLLTDAPDGTSRLFIVEQGGRIMILNKGRVRSTPFLSLAGKVSKGDEQGLLGLAFHPKFATNRKLYVNYTNLSGDTVIRQYKVSTSNRNVVDMSSGRTILTINQPYANHNGGMLAFGPDGYLYIGMGDGGSAGDPGNRAQSTSSLLGKMLRIGVNSRDSGLQYHIPAGNPYVGISGRDEIWQRGLRNPWRWSFDRSTGDLWIGDVGQGSWEEVDRAPASGSGPGKGVNWGWNVLEGTHCYPPSVSSCSTSGKTPPLLEYDHNNGRCAITGGYVYRGSEIPVLRGGYVFGDYCSGEIWVVAANAGAPATRTRLLDTGLLISSFGQTNKGELYVVDLGGRLYRVVQG
jgi:glucose/arabinose dehydrogenase